MPPAMTAVLLGALGVIAGAGMRAGWLHRGRRSAGAVPHLPTAPAAGDEVLGAALTAVIEATYVSTTMAGDWLDRVVAHDLGVRSAARVRVHDAGVLLERTGARDLYVPADAVRGAGTAAGMAGKFVGRDGLVVLTWQAPGPDGALLDTGLRLRHAADRAPLLEALGAFVPVPEPGSRTTTEGTR